MVTEYSIYDIINVRSDLRQLGLCPSSIYVDRASKKRGIKYIFGRLMNISNDKTTRDVCSLRKHNKKRSK